MTVVVNEENNAPQASAQSRLRSILAPVLLVIIGLSIILYPVVATYWNNYQQGVVAQQYAELEKGTPQEVLNEQLIRAQEYNQHMKTGPILDPWLARVTKDNAPYTEYAAQLNITDSMGRIIVPAAKVDLPIYHGTEEKVLQKGVGHLFGSHLPVGGESTHSVLTGHTGLPHATLFDNLVDVKVGDAIYVQAAGEKFKYLVDKIDIVLPDDSDSLRPVQGEDRLTLITCTPYGINTHRILVHSHRVPLDPEDEKVFEDGVGFTAQWWMWAILAGAILVLLLLGLWIWKMLRKNKSSQEEESIEDSSEEV